MRKFFRRPIRVRVGRKHLHFGNPVQIIFWGIVFIFVAGAYYSFGPSGMRARESNEPGAGERKVSKIVAKMGGDSISRDDYEKQIAALGLEESGLPEQAMRKLQTLDQMIDERLQLGAVGKEDIKVSGSDIDKKREEMVDQSIQMRFPNKRNLKEYLQRKRLTYEQYKEQLASERFGDREALRRQLELEKLRDAVQGRVQLSDQELRDSFTEYHAVHILIMPDKERQRAEDAAKAAKQAPPADFNADEIAKKKADEVLAKVNKGEDFAALAKQYSDDTSNKDKGGDLDWFKKGAMVPEFDAVVQALKPGQVSALVKTQFGYHIIKLLGTRSTLPKDFEKGKEQYRQSELEQRKQRAWADYVKGLRQQNPVVIVDAELQGYKDLEERKIDEAEKALAQAVVDDPTAMPARYMLAILYRQKKEYQKAVDLMTQVTENEYGAKFADAHMLLGDLLLELKKKDDALAAFRNASDRAVGNDFRTYGTHEQLRDRFKKLGRPELAAAETKWMDEFVKRQKESGGGGMGMGMPMGMPMSVPIK